MEFPLFLFLLAGFLVAMASAGCVDDHGRHVDWLVLYKFPRKSKVDPGVNGDGLAYAYFTSSDPDKGWTLADVPVSSPDSIPGRILGRIYSSRDENAFHAFYNDEHPDGRTSFTRGHTKGVVYFNESDGFWLVHSVPKFPPELPNRYGYPDTGRTYGQTFLCISLRTNGAADIIGGQMLFNDPFVYSTRIPTWVDLHYKNLASAARGHHVERPPFSHSATFKSAGGLSFTSFAKFSKFDKDLYADLVAPALKANLMVESWPNGPGKMNSSCHAPYQVLNVDGLDFDLRPDDVAFKTRKDHAKWAISFLEKAKASTVCIGDINRMESQKTRAGGTVCFENKAAWAAFRNIISAVESCPQRCDLP